MSPSCNSIKNNFYKSPWSTLTSFLRANRSRNCAMWVKTWCAKSEMPRTVLSATINAAPSGSRNGCKLTANFSSPSRHRLLINHLVTAARKRCGKIFRWVPCGSTKSEGANARANDILQTDRRASHRTRDPDIRNQGLFNSSGKSDAVYFELLLLLAVLQFTQQ